MIHFPHAVLITDFYWSNFLRHFFNTDSQISHSFLQRQCRHLVAETRIESALRGRQVAPQQNRISQNFITATSRFPNLYSFPKRLVNGRNFAIFLFSHSDVNVVVSKLYDCTNCYNSPQTKYHSDKADGKDVWVKSGITCPTSLSSICQTQQHEIKNKIEVGLTACFVTWLWVVFCKMAIRKFWVQSNVGLWPTVLKLKLGYRT
jgi:hypothetical protein